MSVKVLAILWGENVKLQAVLQKQVPSTASKDGVYSHRRKEVLQQK